MFQKGKSGNPSGRPALPDDVRKAIKEDAATFYRSLSKVLRMNRNELTALAKDTTAPVMDLMVASLAAKAVKDGDPQRIRLLTERIAGKVPDKIEFDGDVRGDQPAITHAVIFQAIQEQNRKKAGGAE